MTDGIANMTINLPVGFYEVTALFGWQLLTPFAGNFSNARYSKVVALSVNKGLTEVSLQGDGMAANVSALHSNSAVFPTGAVGFFNGSSLLLWGMSFPHSPSM